MEANKTFPFILTLIVGLSACGAGSPSSNPDIRPALTEDITLTVRADSQAGPLPTWYEPSAFFGWTSNQMKLDFVTDSVATKGMVVESTQVLLGPSTSLADYQLRLATSGLAQEAQAVAVAGGQFLIQVHGMPIWISSSNVTARPLGCEEEWPTYQTVSPDPAKWADWEAAVNATVTYFNVTHGLTNVWYQFWEEPDGPCFWTDTQAKFLETWQHFVAAARSADPNARLGGPEPANGPAGIKLGESIPIMQAFLEYSAAQSIQLDFVSYHLFGNPPEQGRSANRDVLSLLSANGFASVPIVVGSWNPLNACYEDNYKEADPSWPSPPSALGCWQTDTEMGASYSLAFMSYLAEGGTPGYQVMFALDDADIGGTEEFPHDWGLRTNKNKNGLRKAIYHAQTIVGRLPRSLVATTLSSVSNTQEYFPHFFALAGAEGDKLGVLLWSYVTSPREQAREILKDMGYQKADLQQLGGDSQVEAFLTGAIPASSLTSVAQEQTDLQTVKDAYARQRNLLMVSNRISFEISGFASSGGYQVTRYLIDESHNNPYATYVASGLAAAIAGQQLQVLDSFRIAALSDLPSAALQPYSAMLIEIERNIP